ncbi:uncharacterized protein LOC588928 isoform X5 [Strongylocentrotus purpuratus]|uniref:HYR domain-containing protein n=1 Tax=Strongylocentrotus purpuratus TaxID=7668 RepID=A0A7M7N3X4_STRPU|nr:uncharacterized protein LOC588928 isoform X5 [Strongylocentrotus purpuratus]
MSSDRGLGLLKGRHGLLCIFFSSMIISTQQHGYGGTDNENPVISGCPTDQSVNTDSGRATAVVKWTPPTATDNSGNQTLTSSHNRGDLFPIGNTTVTYTSTDAAGNIDICTFLITVADNENPVISGCPTDQSVNTDSGRATAVVKWTSPTATDNSGNQTLTSSHNRGDLFPIGNTTVTYTSTDAAGNIDICTFLITVADNENPVISGCPTDQSVNTDSGRATAVVKWTSPTATDNSGNQTLTSSHNRGDLFPIGNTTVTYTSTDAAGNIDICTFLITVADNENPVISGCPTDQSVNTDSGRATAVVKWTPPTATDNSGNQTLTSSHNRGDLFPIGNTTVTYTSTDAAGNIDICTFLITVADNENPVISGCPTDQSVNTDSGRATAVVKWTPPTATDNSGNQTLTSSHNRGDLFPIGNTTVTYTSTDAAGNIDICTFLITVADNENPVISGCPSDQNVNTDSGNATAVVSWTPPTATDNSGNQTLTSTDNPGDYFPIGNTTVNYTSTDAAGNMEICTFIITVADIEDPVLSGCFSLLTLNALPGVPFAIVNWVDPTATDNSGLVTVTGTHSSGNRYNIGETMVTFTAADDSGNEDMCTFTIEVVDVEGPILMGCMSSDVVTNTTTGLPVALVNYGVPTATDNSGAITANLTSGLPPGNFSLGNTLVMYTAADPSGNSVSCSFYVNVSDVENPVFTSCPSSQTVGTDFRGDTAMLNWTVTVTDNDAAVLTSDYNTSYVFPLGKTTVTYNATDNSSNSAMCVFTFTVEDQEAPYYTTMVSTCPTDVVNITVTDLNYRNISWIVPQVQDNVDPTVNLTGVSESHSPGSQFFAGTTTVIYQATDLSGNTGNCTFQITINDEQVPDLTGCPSDMNATTDPGVSYATTVNWTAPVFTDNVDIINATSSHSPLDKFIIGVTEVSYNGSDSAGNVASCTFIITVSDNENPVIGGCPSDQSVNTDSGNATAVVTWMLPAATDNSGSQMLTSTDNPEDSFPIGNNTVTYTSTDAAGYTDNCTFYIVVNDNENPVIGGCPSDQSVNTNSGRATAVVKWTTPTATDNSGNQTLTSTDNPGDSFPIGNNTVTYTSTDAAGNTDTCTFYISVTDNENPVIGGCPSDQSVNTDSGNATAVVTWMLPPATDNSGSQMLTSTDNSGDSFPIGNNTVTYTSTDAAGNTDTCTFYIFVIDNENAVFSGCPGDQNVNTDSGRATAVVKWTPPTATDNSGNQTLTSSHNPGDYFPLGNTTVNYTSTDTAGNIEMCTFLITVADNEVPLISGCISTLTSNALPGQAFDNLNWVEPTATDNAGQVNMTGTHVPGAMYYIGDTTVTFTAVDDSGNIAMCIFVITILDMEDPVLMGCMSSDIVTNTTTGQPVALVNYGVPTATDNSGAITANLTSGLPPGNFSIGNTLVMYTAADPSGNSVSCNSFYVNVSDVEAPVLVCPSNIVNNTEPGLNTANVTWSEPTYTDNSGRVRVSPDYPSGATFGIITATVVTYTAVDDSGNMATCSFNVTVIDNENPVISGCPSDQNVNTDNGNATAVITWMPPTASDNSGNQTLTSSHNPGDPFPIGNTTVKYKSTDAAGKTDTCIFFVVVTDNENPVISGCPTDQSVNTDSGRATAVVKWTPPTATDNSGNQTLTSTDNPGDSFPIGNNTVTYTSKDAAGNTDTCTFYISVTDNENPVISGCPSDQNVNTDNGNATAVVTWMPPTASDNSGNQTLTSSHNPEDPFPIGNTTVKYTSTDAAGNTDTCIFFVIVTDNENPVIRGCPTDQSVNTDRGNATAVVTYTTPTATDNSGNMTLTSTNNPGDSFPIGNNTVTYTSTDAVGNTDTCTFYISVTDNENPVISGCPSDQNVNTDNGNATAVITWMPPTASDNSGNQTLTSSHNPGDPFPIGNTTVKYTSTDAAGKTDTCIFFVVVTDNENPVISGCPTDQSVNTDSGRATAVVKWTPPTATDNSGNQTLTSTDNPGDSFPIGNNTVTYTSKDAAGNTDTCTFYISVTDNENPVISGCPSDQNVNTDNGNATAVVTWMPPTASDNSGNQTLTSSHNPEDPFPIGNTTVKYTSTDAAGNTDTCIFFVIVTDNENPVIRGCPTDQSVNTDRGNATAVVTYTTPTATDNSGNMTLTSTNNPGDSFPIGNNTVTYTSTDAVGNTDTCTFYISVTDNENPVISGCPSDQNVNTDNGNATAVITWMPPTASDNSGNQTLTSSHNPGDPFPIGNTTVKYTSTDAAGKTDTCIFFVVVTDNENPVISGCPSDQNVNTDNGNATAVVTWMPPTASDNSGNQTLTSSHNPEDPFPIGNTTVKYTSTDAAGNTDTCIFFVIVTDNENPVIRGCPTDQSVNIDRGNATAVVTYTTPTATDNSGNMTLTSTNNPGDSFPIGNNTVTYTSTDAVGNTDTCTFYISVTDNENPVISGCPSDQNVNTDNGNATAVITWMPPTASDNSGNQTLTSSHNPGDPFPIGNTTVKYTSTDAAGKTDTCIFFVVVTDNENPVISGCPTDQSVNTDSGRATAVVKWTPPTATDNSGNQTLTSTDNPGDSFPIGNNTVTYTSKDAAGNTDTCTFYISVTDNENPVISGCPSDQNVNTDNGNATAVVTWMPPTASDNSGNQTLTSSHNPEDPFPIGNTTVKYTSTDAAGNTDTCIFFVIVTDNENPVIRGCPTDQSVNTDRGNATAVVTYTAPTATDNSGNMTLTSTNNPGDSFPIGNNTVTYTSTDAVGNTDTCTFYISVTDNENPVISGCPSDQNVNTDNGNATAVVTWMRPTASDNSGNQTLTSSHNPGDPFPIGNTTVKYTSTDAAGKTDTCIFFVVVTDVELPTVSPCPSDIVVQQDSGTNNATVAFSNVTIADNDAVIYSNYTHNSGDTFLIGSTQVTIYAEDASGNNNTCQFMVTVRDTEDPVIGCLSDITVNSTAGQSNAIVSWTPPNATDNSGSYELTFNTAVGASFEIGSFEVIYIASDDAGNTDRCTFFVNVEDPEDPVFTFCPTNQEVFAFNNVSVEWLTPAVTDNSVGPITLTSNYANGTEFAVGNYTVTYTATDPSSNSATCSFIVQVYANDSVIPLVMCPSDIMVDTFSGVDYRNVSWGALTYSDNMEVVSVESNYLNDSSPFYLGTTVVMYNVTDRAGNTASCDFSVTVQDNEDPALLNCPSDISQPADTGLSDTAVNWTAANATDNSGSVSLSVDMASGTRFPIGTTLVTYTANDGDKNMATCSFNVTVTDDQAPTFMTCPSNITVGTDANENTANVTLNAVYFIDNSGSVNVSKTHTSGDTFPLGTTNVIITATDPSGNEALCQYSVSVYDDEAPMYDVCPSDMSVFADAGSTNATVNITNINFSDNATPPTRLTLNTSHQPRPVLDIGPHIINSTATDSAGLVGYCTYTVTVIDNQAPNITCPANIVNVTDPGLAVGSVSWSDAVARDNTGSLSVSPDIASGSNFTVGVTTVTYNTTDPSGNPATCSFTVTISDMEIPVISNCPADINVTTDAGSDAKSNVMWTEPTATDNTITVALSGSDNPGMSFILGEHQVTYTAADQFNNEDTCVFTIRVTDVEDPVLTNVPPSVNVSTDPGQAGAIVSPSPATATDNSGAVMISSTAPADSFFPIGATTVVVTAMDASGNQVNATYVVTVQDDEAPTFDQCPVNLQVAADPGSTNTTVNWTAPVFMDNSGNVTITENYVPPTVLDLGSYVVMYNASDAAGNTIACMFTVTVVDEEAANITCPSDMSVSIPPDRSYAVANWSDAVAVDNTGPLNVTSDIASGSNFTLGMATVTYTTQDAAGNPASCSFVVNVTDNISPVFDSCPSNPTYATPPGQATRAVEWFVSVTDNSGWVSITSTHNVNESFPVGMTEVTYQAVDASGNSATCVFSITINDQEPPMFLYCPSSLSPILDSGNSTEMVTWSDPVVSDNTVNYMLTSNYNPGDMFALGSTVVEYVAVDDSGNNATCTFTVSVRDLEDPVFTVCNTSDVVQNTDNGMPNTSVSWSEPTATDNTDNVTVTGDYSPGAVFTIGTTLVTYTTVDSSSNMAMCSFNVIVIDAELPDIQNCPANLTVSTDLGSNQATNVTWTEPSASDNSGSVGFVGSKNSGAMFPFGSSPVYYMAVDASGNEAECSFYVSVEDNEDPMITCPFSISSGTTPSLNTSVVWWTVPTATDNTGVASVVSDYTPGQMFPVGNTLVTYNATDLGGNVAVCSFYVNVTDDMIPSVLTCPIDFSQTADNGLTNTTVTWAVPTFSDNDGNVMVSANYKSPSVLSIGVWTVMYNATDLSGNVAQCVFVITVTDDEAPTITCPTDIVNVSDPGLDVASVSWADAVATDNTGNLRVSSDIVSGSNFTVGLTTVTYSTTDPSGNPASCSFTVEISDEELPSISGCPSNITQSADPGSVTTSVNWTVPVFTDNAGFVSVVDSHQPLNIFYVGTAEVSYTGVDPQGNEDSCIFQVTVVDMELPVFINCPSNMSVTTDPETALAEVSWPTVLATDNAGTPLITTDFSGSNFSIGVQTVSYNATDDAGNIAQCTFDITVTDDQPPTYVGCPSDITVAADVGSVNARVKWTVPSAMDNVDTSALQLYANYEPPTVLAVGSYIVNYTAVDVDGLVGECVFTVTVTDGEAPVITCPANIVNVTDPGLAVASVSWSDAVAADNTGSLSVSSDIVSGSNFTVGVTTVTYNTTDPSGNPSTCSFTVTISDEEKPMLLNCPSDITYNITDSSTQANVTWPAPMISDNTDMVITVISTHPGSLFNFGDTTVVYTVQDLSGNSISCSFVVSVDDMTPPVIEGCPSSINTTTDAASPTAMVTFQSPNITDNQGTPTVMLNKQSGSEFPVGDTVITYTATDTFGNVVPAALL